MTKDKQNLDNVWDKTLPNLADKKREQLNTSGCKGDGSSLRMRLGLYYTNEEFEKMKKKLSKKKLP